MPQEAVHKMCSSFVFWVVVKVCFITLPTEFPFVPGYKKIKAS